MLTETLGSFAVVDEMCWWMFDYFLLLLLLLFLGKFVQFLVPSCYFMKIVILLTVISSRLVYKKSIITEPS